jgi:hypothetical protein
LLVTDATKNSQLFLRSQKAARGLPLICVRGFMQIKANRAVSNRCNPIVCILSLNLPKIVNMKFTCETVINLPVDRVVELFDNPDNLRLWMPGLESMEHISGTPGMPGAKSKLTFKMGKRKMEMIETISIRNLPEEFSGVYEARGVFNIVKNHFIPLTKNQTRYVSEQEFQLKGVMKLFGLLMPGAFKKQSQTYLEKFKQFAEKQG